MKTTKQPGKANTWSFPIENLMLAASLLLSCMASVGGDIREGLVAYWPVDTINGTTTPDYAYGNDFTVANSPTAAAGQVGNALTFNGTSQYMAVTHSTNFNDAGLPIYSSPMGYTVAVWVKGAAGQSGKTFFGEGNTAMNNPMFILAPGGTGNSRLRVFIRATGGATVLDKSSTTVVFDGTWHHIAWVDNRGIATLYVDGVADATSFKYTYNQGAVAMNTTAVGALLRASAAGFCAASCDDLALWQRPLSQAEVNEVRTLSITTPIPAASPVLVQFLVPSTNYLGDRATFSVSAIGKLPLTYEWFRNGVNLLGKTDSTLALTDLTTSGTNQVTVIVSNSLGAATNETVLVVVEDPPAAIASGLVSYWPLDQAVGTAPATPDLYSLHEMVLNSMDSSSLVSGQFGSAIAFDGATQFASLTNRVPIYNTNAYSISFWVKGDVQPSRTVYGAGSKGGTTPIFGFSTEASGFLDNLVVFLRNDNGVLPINNRLSTRSVFDQNWHHIVWTDQGGRARLYIDGILDETEFSYTPGAITLNTTALGAMLRSTTNGFFAGSVDSVAEWARRLTWTEIQTIMSMGVPPPASTPTPILLDQPADAGSGVYPLDTVSFSVRAVGIDPLSFQWLFNGVPISLALNPTAQSNVLTVGIAQIADTGGYSVVVTNVGGSTTSRVAQLVVAPYTPMTTGEALKMDFGLTGSPNAQPSFNEWSIASNPAQFDGVKVTLLPIGGATTANFQERLRGNSVVNNPPALTQQAIYDDFFFVNNTNIGAGVKILIEHLAPNTKYGLTVWSWTTLQPEDTSANWIETSSGNSVPIAVPYTWSTQPVPTRDYDRTFGALLTSSDLGKLQIEGTKTGGTLNSILLNGLRLVAQPEIRIVEIQLVDGKLRLTVEAQYPGQPISIEQSDSINGSWTAATGGAITEVHGPVVSAEFFMGTGPVFFRAVSQ